MKYCKHCGSQIDDECVICPKCGKQVEDLQSNKDQQIIINNSASSSASAAASAVATGGTVGPKAKNKWVAFFLCLFLGMFGAHKFYEGKILLGILYLCTFGLIGVGWVIDIFRHLFKPNPYYV